LIRGVPAGTPIRLADSEHEPTETQRKARGQHHDGGMADPRGLQTRHRAVANPVQAVACPCPAALTVMLQPQPPLPPARTHARTPPSLAVPEELAEQQAPLEPPGLQLGSDPEHWAPTLSTGHCIHLGPTIRIGSAPMAARSLRHLEPVMTVRAFAIVLGNIRCEGGGGRTRVGVSSESMHGARTRRLRRSCLPAAPGRRRRTHPAYAAAQVGGQAAAAGRPPPSLKCESCTSQTFIHDSVQQRAAVSKVPARPRNGHVASGGPREAQQAM